jgi:hypothetical protein
LRDQVALTWLAEQYGAPMASLGRLLRPNVSADRRLATAVKMVKERWARYGWVTVLPLAGERWVVPTRAVAEQWLGFEARPWLPSLYTAAHTAAVGRVRLLLCGAPVAPEDLGSWVSERRLRHAQGFRGGGNGLHGESGHMPDGLFVKRGSGRELVEVELTPKDPAAMRAVLAGMPDALRTYRAEHVLYFVGSDAVRRAVERALSSLTSEHPGSGLAQCFAPMREVPRA